MSKKTNSKRTFLSVFLTFCMIVTMGLFSSQVATAAAGDEPEHHKIRKDNGDGTYEIEMNVTGDADTTEQKAANVNVIILYDVSSSMANSAGRYSRADQAEDIAYRFCSNLFGYQDQSDPSNIQMAVVTFGVSASPVTGNSSNRWTSSRNEVLGLFDSGLDGRTNQTYNGSSHNGTNWDEALRQAQLILDSRSTDDDPTFVILLTDGAPTAHGTNGNNPSNPSTASFNEFRRRYGYAAPRAYDIQSRDNVTLYGIYAFGTEADLLDDLLYYSHNDADNPDISEDTDDTIDGYFNASDTEALNEAMDSIFVDIVKTLGIGHTEISDGTTSGVETSSGTIDLLDVADPSTFKYWLTVPYDASTNTFSRKDPVTAEVTTYKLVDNGDGTITVLNNADNSEVVTVTGTMNMGKFRYQWTGKNALYNYNPPAAEFTGTSVDWDLSPVGTLLDGVTYSVTFRVYPSQETYDLIADLKNSIIDYDDLDDNIKQWLHKDGNNYTLETNTGASMSYVDSRVGDIPVNVDYTDEFEGVATDAELLTLQKIWIGSYGQEASNPVNMKILRDGVPVKDGNEDYIITLAPNSDPDKDFKTSVYIAVGLMIIEDGNVEILDEGHDYQLEETGDVSYHWDLLQEILHPMIINGQLTMLEEVEGDDIPSAMGDSDYYVDGDKHYYRLNGNVYTEAPGTDSLTTTNIRRSDLNMTKAVTGPGDPDDEFEFTMNLTDPKGEDIWFSIRDANNQTVTADCVVSGAEPEDGQAGAAYYFAPSGSDVVIKMKAGYNLRFTNMRIGTEYSFTESDIPASYTLDTAEVDQTPLSDEEVPDPIDAPDPAFDEDAGSFTGTITQGNQSYTVTFTNEFEETDVEIIKVWDDNDNNDGIRTSRADFGSKLTLKANGEAVTDAPTPSVIIDPFDSNKYKVKWTGLPRKANGQDITYTVEESSIEGYTTTGSPAQNGGTITNTHEPITTKVTVEKTWEDNSDQDGVRPTTATVQLYRTANGRKTAVGDPVTVGVDDDTWTHEWTGLPVNAGGSAVTYSVEETLPSGCPYTKEVGDGVTAVEGDSGTIEITNSYDPITTQVGVKKIWNDADDQDGIRPDDATVQLYKTVGGQTTAVGDPVTVGTEDDWTYEWTGLPVNDGGNTITYSVEETLPEDCPYDKDEGDAVEAEEDDSGVIEITNSYEPATTSVTVEKVWDDEDNNDGLRPDDATVQLYKTVNGKKTAVGDPVTVGTEDDWTYEWTGLPVNDGGETITYSVEETLPEDCPYDKDEGDAVEAEEDDSGTITVTNTHAPEMIPIKVKVEWVDMDNKDEIRPEDVNIVLMADGEEIDSKILSIENDWEGDFGELPKYKDGVEIEYTVEEEGTDVLTGEDGPGTYAIDSSGSADDIFVITNTHTPEEEIEPDPSDGPNDEGPGDGPDTDKKDDSKQPNTGDDSGLLMYSLLGIISALGLVLLAIHRRQKSSSAK